VLVSGFAFSPRGDSPSKPWFFRSGPAGPPALCGFFTHPFPGRVFRCAVAYRLSQRRCAMHAIHAAEALFAWGELEDCPTLTTIRDALAAVPDQPLLAGLHAARGRGRDDYPVSRLWRIVLLTVLLRHHALEDCLAELHRNPAL